MKNVSCFQLSIERSRAPKKMGTFKDISLFGNFIFPLQGEFAGGIIAHSLAGIGKVVKKTKAQIQKITTRNSPMAGSTGSSISSQLPVPQTREEGLQSLSSQDVYSVRFINHAPEPLQSPSFFPSGRITTNLQPSNGYALKKSSGKRVIFSLAQKEIMISFYNRQASSGVRADPKDVIACMRDRGVEVLKETQIRSWWSTYHQKRKQTLNVLQEEACHLQRSNPSPSIPGSTTPVSVPGSTVPVQQPTPVSVPGSTVPVQQPTPVSVPGSTVPVQELTPVSVPGSTVPVQQPTPVSVPGLTVPVQQPTPISVPGSTVPVQHPTPVSVPGSTVPVQQPAPVSVPGLTTSVQQPTPVPRRQPNPVCAHTSTVPTTVSQSTIQPTLVLNNTSRSATAPFGVITGYTVPGLTDILQWTFPADFCQSTLGGRSGSNACTFIALYFGHLYLHWKLPPPLHSVLSMEWKSALYKAMKKGNEIHDELFEGEGVDVAVEDAVEMAGTECFVQYIGQGLDLIGSDCEDQLAEVMEMLSTSTPPSSCNVVVTRGRSFLFIVNKDRSCMIVDSHRHVNVGAMIAYCPSKCTRMLAKWVRTMFRETWQCDLRACSVTPIFYSTV